MKEETIIVLRAAYATWRSRLAKESRHPREEALVCFAEGGLFDKERRRVCVHLLHCRRCSEAVAVSARCCGFLLKIRAALRLLRQIVRGNTIPTIVRAYYAPIGAGNKSIASLKKTIAGHAIMRYTYLCKVSRRNG